MFPPDEEFSGQLSHDFRTGRPTAISASELCSRQRAACTAINRERANGILAASRAPSSRQSISVDVWNAAFAQRALDFEVPLIPLSSLGLQRGSDGLLFGGDLIPLPSGAEAAPYLDESQRVVYKLFDLRPDGSLGKRFEIERKSDSDFPGLPEEERYSVVTRNATLQSTLIKLAFLNQAGAHPTEIVGLTECGDFLLAKQPQAKVIDQRQFERLREAAINAMRGVEVRRVRLGRVVVALWVDGTSFLMSDLHRGNIMLDHDENPTVIDALVGSVSERHVRNLPLIQNAFDHAQALRFGRKYEDPSVLRLPPDEEL